MRRKLNEIVKVVVERNIASLGKRTLGSQYYQVVTADSDDFGKVRTFAVIDHAGTAIAV